MVVATFLIITAKTLIARLVLLVLVCLIGLLRVGLGLIQISLSSMLQLHYSWIKFLDKLGGGVIILVYNIVQTR